MKILIAYAGKSGTTEKCAKKLCEKLTNATAVNLNLETPDINQYDRIVEEEPSARVSFITRQSNSSRKMQLD